MYRFPLTMTCLVALGLSACSGTGQTSGRDLARIQLIKSPIDRPPLLAPGECQDHATLPLIIETTSDQVLVTAELRGPDGAITVPASYSTVTQQRIVQDRHEVWFRVPCPEVWSVNFIATVQRALKARGFFRGEVTGEYGVETAEAVRRFQADRGLDSPLLSIDAARELGISAVEL